MQPTENGIPPQQGPTIPPDWPADPEIETREPRNLPLMAIHQIVFRTGWIFKTESVIMPAFLDWLAPAGWLRGCMPVLNRLGQSVPPILCAETIRSIKRKKWALAATVLLMSVPFAALSIVCLTTDARQKTWTAGLFLLLYLAFFCLYGLYRMSFGTVQGKLIRPTRRGHLLLVSTFWGSIPAMVFAWWLLPGWLECVGRKDDPGHTWGYVFAFVASCFLLSGLIALLLYEPADELRRRPAHPLKSVAETWQTLRQDSNLRRLVLVAMLFGSGLMIFPHYQALARERLGLVGTQLVIWVIVQNAAIGVYSLVVGPLADAWGNRLTLRVLIFGSAVAPLLAIGLSHADQRIGAALYWLVFVSLGVTPLVLQIVINYTLEICQPSKHPRYLSTVSVCVAVPFLLSPAVGGLVDLIGFDLVYLVAAGLVLLSGLMTFRLEEPRHRVPASEVVTIEPAGQE